MVWSLKYAQELFLVCCEGQRVDRVLFNPVGHQGLTEFPLGFHFRENKIDPIVYSFDEGNPSEQESSFQKSTAIKSLHIF